MGTVKAAKAAARHLRETGTRPKDSSTAGLAAVGVVIRDKQRKGASKKVSAGGLDDDEDARTERLANMPSRVYAGASALARACVASKLHRQLTISCCKEVQTVCVEDIVLCTKSC
jgi:hypothetical protein